MECIDWLRSDRVIVRICFGDHLIRSWSATSDQAAAYEEFVHREFWGLTVETSPLPAAEAYEPLPEPHWWLRVPV